MEKTVEAHHACVRTVFANTVPPARRDDIWQTPPLAADSTLDACGRERHLVTRRKERFAAVQQLLADGSSLEGICQTLRLDRSTVRRFARATSIDEPLPCGGGASWWWAPSGRLLRIVATCHAYINRDARVTVKRLHLG